MLSRRRFLERALRGSSLVAVGPMVPGFLAATARAAEPGRETILVVLELTGGNDGLNTVVPFADDHYQRARPTLRLGKPQVVRIDDQIGLNPGLRGLEKMLESGQLAVVQGVGYPNPNRSHFESMDVWQSADPENKAGTGWLGRGLGGVRVAPGKIPGLHVGTEELPLALRGAGTAVPTLHPSRPYDLELALQPVPMNGSGYVVTRPIFPPGTAPAAGPRDASPRRRLIEELAELAPARDPLHQFARRTALETYATLEHLREITRSDRESTVPFAFRDQAGGALARNLALVGRLIAGEFGTRIFYVALPGFDTHADQLQGHQQLLQQVGDAVAGFFAQLERSGHAGRVVLMTFSEFGRRVQENGSKGTDHGAGSCLFVAGPGVRGGLVGAHPSLAPDALDAGDLKHHTDFRRVYATLLDGWLGCPSAEVLGGTFEPIPLLKQG